jgi:hypothetical protein
VAMSAKRTPSKASGRREPGVGMPIIGDNPSLAVPVIATDRDGAPDQDVPAKPRQSTKTRAIPTGGAASAKGNKQILVIAHQLAEPMTAIGLYLEASLILLGGTDPERISKARGAIGKAEAQIVRVRDLLRKLHRLAD